MVAMQYPEIWSGRRIALPGGWCDLVAAFSEQLHRHAPGCRVAGCSEKYGTLRLDCVGDDLDVAGLLEQIYEDLSETVCQDCGEPGSLRTDRTWYATLCDAHALKRDPR